MEARYGLAGNAQWPGSLQDTRLYVGCREFLNYLPMKSFRIHSTLIPLYVEDFEISDSRATAIRKDDKE